MGGHEEEANYAYGRYRRGGYRGNYYGISFGNWHDRQPQDKNHHLQLCEDKPSPKKKHEESKFEKTMQEFMIAQKSSNGYVKNLFFNFKTKFEQGQKNHQDGIHDLKTILGRLFDQNATRPTGALPSTTQLNPKPSGGSNDKAYRLPPARTEHVNVVCTRGGKTYDPPSNTNDKITIINYDSDDEAEEKAKEDKLTPSTSKQTEPIPMKAYKPRIPLQEPDSPKVAPTSPDYVLGPEEPEQVPLSPDYVLGLEYPEYLAPSAEEVPVEDQPYVVADSPIALSPGYVADSDPVEDPEEDSEDGLADYLADGGDIDDDDSSDNDEEEEASEEEEEKHLALSDSVVAPVVDYVPSFEETESFETYESAATPPLPSSLHLPPHVPTSLPLPSSPLPPLPVSLFIPPPVDRREDIPEAELPPRKRLCLTALTSRYKVGESSTTAPRPTGGHRIEYGFIGTLAAKTRRQRAEEEQDTQDVYAVIEDTQDRHTQLFQRVDGLVEDRQFHYETANYAGLPYRLTGVTDDDIDYTCFITTGTVVSGIMTDSGISG
ncbi:hypothetical protein Tco_0175440 [Tanacetum coccineum]